MLTSQIKTNEEYNEIVNALDPLSEPARPAWIMARVAALLSQYYAADVPAAAVAIMAEDWLEELRDYPQWAITNAVRWWKSSENPNRKKKPLEGDIAERCRLEMGVVRVAEKACRDFLISGPTTTEPSEQDQERWDLTPAEREEKRARANDILKQAGFAVRSVKEEG